MAAEAGQTSVSFPVSGVVIAVVSSCINGSTFVLQKKGILRSRDRGRRVLRVIQCSYSQINCCLYVLKLRRPAPLDVKYRSRK